jgi:hypothetical protein
MGERKVDECHNLLVYLGNLKQVTDHEQGCKTNVKYSYLRRCLLCYLCFVIVEHPIFYRIKIVLGQ